MDNILSGESEGIRLQNQFIKAFRETASFFEEAASREDIPMEFLRKYGTMLRELADASRRPFNVAVFGRMKTGKSSLINALIGKNLAITGTEEATATLNLISHSASKDLLDTFTVHWKNRPAESYCMDRLEKDWTGKSAEVVARVAETKYLQLYSDHESLKLHEIIDTPGTGSDAKEHEDAARNFLQNFSDVSTEEGRRADALVYVFPPVAHESDDNALGDFRKGCLPNSDPYNSIAVLHKWDHIFWESNGNLADIQKKADRIMVAMAGKVAAVLPVSAPMAIVAQSAPEVFFASLKKLVDQDGAENLMRALSRDEKWDRDSERERIRKLLVNCPWSSFQCIVRECATHGNESTDMWRKRILDISGMPAFREFLDSHFFKQGAIIRQKQNLVRLNQINQQAQAEISKHIRLLEKDQFHWTYLGRLPNLPDTEHTWIVEKADVCRHGADYLQGKLYELDRIFLNSIVERNVKDQDAIRWMDSDVGRRRLADNERKSIQAVLDILSGSKSESPSSDDVEEALGTLKRLENFPNQNVRQHSGHLSSRLVEFLNRLP